MNCRRSSRAGPAEARLEPSFQERRLEALLEASRLFTSDTELGHLLQRVTDVAAELIGARYAAIGVIAPDGARLQSFTTSGISEELRHLIGHPPEGHGILGLVIRESRAIRLPDLMRHPDSFGFPPHHPHMHSFLGAPIVGRQGVFGNLYLTEKLGGGLFTDEDESLVLLLAAQAAAAVENARLHEERERLLNEVQILQRRRERFFAMVNHELRNALAGVYGWAEMLVRRKDPTTVPRAAFEVLDSAEGAVALINDLLDLSRLDEERMRPQISRVDPLVLARRAVTRVTPAAQAKGVELTVTAARRLHTIPTDSTRVEQILINLLTNAIRHTPASTRVRVSVAELEAGVLTFTVEDEGAGVAVDDLERIFDIYETKPGEEGKGVGLGLPLSRRLARLLGGQLRAVHRPMMGGCFLLELPYPKDE
ncbi:MAG: GAF domain-containing sensor histidine kinase [Gemmatimonadales bacterium]|nr:GAF domain-containing sensor histidine kinase [Gemmatimonadales bacterium]